MIGSALYWAEGYKKQQNTNSPCICFANSDPAMILLFLRFLREIIEVPEKRIRLSIQIHPNLDKKSIVNFWASITDISQERIRTKRCKSRASKGKRPKNTLPYGTADVRVSKRQYFFKIRGWIDGIKKFNT